MKNTHVTLILDKSGSMSVVQKQTISSINEYINSLKKDKKNSYKMTITLFDTLVTSEKTLPIADVKELNGKTYSPDGMTALYDAVCSTLNKIKESKDKNLVVIITDGEENSSKEHTEKDFKDIVEKLNGKKNWTFVYLGANQDAWGNAQKWGFHQGNVSNFNQTTNGIRAVSETLFSGTCMFAASQANATMDFLSEDKQKLEDTL